MPERLQDPYQLIDPNRLVELRNKLSSVITGMMLSKELGGNPFIYALVAAKPHRLTDRIPGWPADSWRTAATDGRQFYWHPEFIQKLTNLETRIVMEHEAYHNIFWHTAAVRSAGKNMIIWSYAIDYVVNTVIWEDRKPADPHHWQRSQPKQPGQPAMPPPPHPGLVFNGNLGTPISLQQLIDVMTGKSPIPPPPVIFVDAEVANKSADWIYEQIMRHWDKILEPFKGGMGAAGEPLDAHVPSELTHDEANYELLAAHEKAKMMGRGELPAGIQELIDELTEPTLRPSDIVQSAMLTRIQDEGANKDYRRYRRRFISSSPPQWYPHNYDFRPRWVWLQDCSGSMGKSDITACISEAKLVGPESEGWIVPCDAQPYWDQALEVRKSEDLQLFRATGRGGTVFRQFFEELPEKMGLEWDVVVVGTDAMIDDIPPQLAPPCDVLWLICNDHVDFKPPFGRIIRLRRK